MTDIKITSSLTSEDLGSSMQDCSLITSLFERGAHSTQSEAAVFATFNRSLENTRSISQAMVSSLTSYLKSPRDMAAETAATVPEGVSVGSGSSGTSAATDQYLQGLNLRDNEEVALGNSFGSTVLDKMKECIPCLDRITAYLELKPNIDLLAALQVDVLARLQFLNGLGDLLKDLNVYGDLCDLLGLLSFMCISDLQALIAMLMALLILDIPKFDGMIGLLQGLIFPIFAPILSAITSLLDQFSLTVMSPIDCIIDAINEQLQKLNYELDPNSPLHEVKGGIAELNKMVLEAKDTIQEKLTLYIENLKNLLGELNFGGSAYLMLSVKKLKIIRMVAFIAAIIRALSKGTLSCSSQGQTPEESELEQFFNNYLNPNSPFDMWLDQDGAIHIDEKVPEQAETLSTFNNVFSFSGEDLINTTATSLVKPASAIIPCRLVATTTEDAQKINQWIAEINEAK